MKNLRDLSIHAWHPIQLIPLFVSVSRSRKSVQSASVFSLTFGKHVPKGGAARRGLEENSALDELAIERAPEEVEKGGFSRCLAT